MVVNTVLKNTVALFLAEIFGYLLSFFLIVAIARYLGDAGLGIYSFAFAFTGLFLILSDPGLSSLVIRDVSRDKSKAERYFENVASIKLILGIISMLLPIIIIFFIEKSVEIVVVVIIAAVASFFTRYIYAFTAFFKAYEKMEYEFWTRVVERVIAVSLGIYLLMKGYGLIALMLVFLLSYSASFLLAAIIFAKNKIAKFRLKADFALWKGLVKNALPFWMTALFITLYFKIDTVMLSLMQNYVVTGWYSAAYKIIDMFSKAPFIVVIALFPAMSRLHAKSKEVLRSVYKRSFYYLFMLAFPLGIGMWLIASRVILFIYKEAFSESAVVLQILVIALVFIFVNYLMGYLLDSIKKQVLFTIATGIGLFINVTLNLILIPLYSYIGASIATVITEVAVFGLLFYFTKKEGYPINLAEILPKPVMAGVIMGLFISQFYMLHLFLLIFLSIIIYFGVLYLIKGIGKEETGIIKSFIKEGFSAVVGRLNKFKQD